MAHMEIDDKTRTTFPLRYWELVWYSLILVIGALGNLLVCLAFFKSSKVFRSTPFNIYLCSLAFTDLCVALTALPQYLLSTPIFNHPHGEWGDFMCRTITGDFLSFYISTVSGYSLIVICLERLHALHAFPRAVPDQSSRQKKRVWLSIGATWLIPFLIDGPRAIYLLKYKREQKPVIGNYCTFVWGGEPTVPAKVYGGIILLCHGLIPLVIFLYSFYAIRKCLVREEKRMLGPVGGNTFNDGYRYFNCWKIVQRRHKTAKILMMATAAFVVFCIPNHAMFFVINYLGHTKHAKLTWNSVAYQIGILMRFTQSCINPFLYAWQSKEFRKHSKMALKSLLPKCINDDFVYKQAEDIA